MYKTIILKQDTTCNLWSQGKFRRQQTSRWLQNISLL